MDIVELLRNNGYGVVEGVDEVKQKIIELGYNDPRKGKNMNKEFNNLPVAEDASAMARLDPNVEAAMEIGTAFDELPTFAQDIEFSEAEVTF